MSLLNKLEDRFGRLAVPQLTVVLIACQVVVFAVAHTAAVRGDDDYPGETLVSRLELVPERACVAPVQREEQVRPVPRPGDAHPTLDPKWSTAAGPKWTFIMDRNRLTMMS